MASTTDEVARNSIWREHIKKEDKIVRPNGGFRLNVNQLSPISPNPQSIDPRGERWSKRGNAEEQRRYETIREFFNNHEADQARKDQANHTTNAQLYFQTANSLSMSNTLNAASLRKQSPPSSWRAGRKKCDITKYAEAYVSMAQQSPYSNKTS
ncbi:unnamed protein product [Heterosigma akashiwo]